jgi:hypothetical protein
MFGQMSSKSTSDMAEVTCVFLLAGDKMSQKMSPKMSQPLIRAKNTILGDKCHPIMNIRNNLKVISY